MPIFSPPSHKPQFKKLKEEGCAVTFSVEVPAAAVETETHTHLLRMQQRAQIPGFRPGKAPIDLIRKKFEGHAKEEALDAVLQRVVPQGLKELGLEPVASPSVSDLSLDAGQPLRFKVTAEIAPKVSPKDYLKISVQRKSYVPSEEDVAKRLEDLREGNARLEAAAENAVGAAHYAVIDFVAGEDPRLKGEGELVDMSSDQTIEGLTAGLSGMARGESKSVPVKIDGRPLTLKVTLREIKGKVLPPLDSEFAKDIGFQTVEELRAKLREMMEKEGLARGEREVAREIEKALLKSNPFGVPSSLVEAQLEHSMERLRRQALGDRPWPAQEKDSVRAKLRPDVENELKVSYLLAAIAEKEGIKALEEDLKAELERSLKDSKSDDQRDQVRRLFEERRESISGLIRERKAMAFLREKASVKDT